MKPVLRRNLIVSALTLLLALLPGAPIQPVRADTGYAALLVLFGPDDYYTECIALPGAMTAFDLVRASTLDAKIESTPGSPEAMCSIDGAGCDYPTEDCFCQCGAETCDLWTEWYWDVNQWELAFNADERIVPDGAVEGWVWGDGITEPPMVNFGDICTGVVSGDPPDSPEVSDYPEPPTVGPPANAPYPSGPANTPTLWIPPTRAAVITPTRTAMPTITPLGQQPGSLLTPSPSLAVSTPMPRATQPATLVWATSVPTSTLAAGQIVSTPTTATPASVAPTPGGSTTPDQIAMLIETPAARVRATALAGSRQEQQRRGSGGIFWLGLVAIIVMGYAALLYRQRRLDAAERLMQTRATPPFDAEPFVAVEPDLAPVADDPAQVGSVDEDGL